MLRPLSVLVLGAVLLVLAEATILGACRHPPSDQQRPYTQLLRLG